MFQNFWEGVAGGVAGSATETWANRILGPALFFWGGGAAILLVTLAQFMGWQKLFNFLTNLNSAEGVMLVLAIFLLLTFSDMVLEWATLSILRFLEGYWPGPVGRYLSAVFAERQQNYVKKLKKRLQNLGLRQEWHKLARQHVHGALPAPQQAMYDALNGDARLSTWDKLHEVAPAEIVAVEAELARYPSNPEHILPTQLGNILRSAEEYAHLKYGLKSTTVWPCLWLVLPPETQQEISAARQHLNLAARFLTYSILFAGWSIFTLWAILIALLMAFVAYRRVRYAAIVYGDLLKAAFDLHRFKLYEALRLKLPLNSDDELLLGQTLTNYLEQREAGGSIIFEHPHPHP